MWWLLACGSGVELELVGDLDASFAPPAAAEVVLWGSGGVQDVSASVVDRFAFDVDELPHVERLDVRPEPWTRIDQGAGPVSEDEATYYFTITFDVDGDGEVGAHDWTQQGDVEFYDTVPETVTIALSERI